MKSFNLLMAALLIGTAAMAQTMSKEVQQLFTRKYDVVSMAGANGDMIKAPAGAFLQFDLEKERIMGKGGCNRFFGTAKAKATGAENGSLELGKMGMTMMACPNMDEEQQLMKVMEQVNGYLWKQGKLELQKDGKTVLVCQQSVS